MSEKAKDKYRIIFDEFSATVVTSNGSVAYLDTDGETENTVRVNYYQRRIDPTSLDLSNLDVHEYLSEERAFFDILTGSDMLSPDVINVVLEHISPNVQEWIRDDQIFHTVVF